ncbi:MAG TPA: HpcH/HpaI aldolase/citrate lyase family protein [Sphingomicrobium sp.]|jgi:4-hydroxy-2-oxoheptanedioate aldolase
MITNRFKDALSAGTTQVGLWQTLGSPITVELCAAAGFDWLLLDAEHGPHSIPTLLAQVQAMNGSASQAIVRLPATDATSIKQVLDIGVMTVLAPFVEHAAQARAIVAASRYAPEGIRGLAAGQIRASRWGRDSDYIDVANTHVCVLVQIENRAGLEAVDEIAAVDGVDGVFIGPADLAASLGFRGRPDHPEVLGAIDEAIVRVKRAGKAAGILTLNESLARRYIADGCTFVAVGTDATLLATAVDALAGRFCGTAAAALGY